MGGRYIITGVQLGMIRGLLLTPPETAANRLTESAEKLGDEGLKLVDEIIEEQFVCDSDCPIDQDVKMISKEWL